MSADFGRSWQAAAQAAAPWCSAALLGAFAGAMVVQGHDGLAYSVGIAGAISISALIDGGGRTNRGERSLFDVLAARYQSRAVGQLAGAIVAVALVVLAAAELTVAWRAVALVSFKSASTLLIAAIPAAAVASALWLTGRNGFAAALGTLATLALLIAAPLALGFASSPPGFGSLVFVPTMADLNTLEHALLERRLADPASFKPHATAFLRTDALNFGAIAIALSIGLGLLMAAVRMGDAGDRGATARDVDDRRTRFRTTLVAMAAVLTLAPLAAEVKRALLRVVADGTSLATLPAWMAEMRASGALTLCGSTSIDLQTVTKACGKGVGPQGWMRWQDFAFSPDVIVLAGLETAPGGTALVALLAGLMAVAAVWSIWRVAEAIGAFDARASLRVRIACLVVASASVAGVCAMQLGDGATLATFAAALAAAGLAPAFAGSGAGARQAGAAAASMVAGVAITAGLILAARYIPITLFDWTHGAETMSPALARKLSSLRQTLEIAAEGPGRDAALAQAQRLARDNLSLLGLKLPAMGLVGLAGSVLVFAVAAGLGGVWRRVRRPRNGR